MRVTTNSMMRNYNSFLSTSLNTLNVSRERVASGRLFNRAYQDPTAALRAADLHRKYLKTEDYISTIKDSQSRQDSIDATMQQISKMITSANEDESLKAINGTNDFDARQTYATSLKQMQESLIQFTNSTYEDRYVFAGADGKNIPINIDDAGNVTYRGINVTTGEWPGHTDQEGLDELAKLKDEKLYIDLGLGLRVDTADGIALSPDDINGASAYNMSVTALKALGFGTVDGSNPPISKNVIALVGQMSEELAKPDGEFDRERFSEMLDQLSSCHGDLTDYNAEIGVRAQFLTDSKERLETDKLNIYTQIDAVEYIKPETAITDYSYATYCYNTLLKVGTSLLGNSFVDYMK